MKAFKYIAIAALAIGMAACDGTVKRDGNAKAQHSSYTKQQIDKNIESLSAKPWNKSDYENILNSQIPNLKKASEKTAATSTLKKAYTDVMIRDANKIISEGCTQANAHTTLNAIATELKGFNNVLGYNELVKIKADHDKAVSVASSGVGTQSVGSYKDYYDFGPEKQKMADANQWLNNGNIKCKATKEKLQKMTQASYYQSRRQAFCKAIVSYYEKCQNPSETERNEALARISRANVSNPGTYEQAIYAHYRELNAN